VHVSTIHFLLFSPASFCLLFQRISWLNFKWDIYIFIFKSHYFLKEWIVLSVSVSTSESLYFTNADLETATEWGCITYSGPFKEISNKERKKNTSTSVFSPQPYYTALSSLMSSLPLIPTLLCTSTMHWFWEEHLFRHDPKISTWRRSHPKNPF